MGMLTKMMLGIPLRCKNCAQRSSAHGPDWETLGKHDTYIIVACKRCGHGLRMGIFVEQHVPPEFIYRMREARKRLFSE